MNEIRIDFDRLKTLESALATHPQVVREELEAGIVEADELLLREVQDAWPHASGISRESMHARELVDGLQVQGFVGSSLDYVQPVDLGTKPHFPPIEPLVDWVKIRFAVTSEQQAEHIARAIAWKIFHRGTEGAHVFPEVLARLEPQLQQIFKDREARIANRIGLG